VTWQKDSHFSDSLEPRIGIQNLKKMLSPVLVSMELFGRHFYGGREITRNMFVVNDCEKFQDLPETELAWQVKDGDKVLASGSQKVEPVKYYANLKFPLTIKLPEVQGRVDAKLAFTLKADGKLVSENDYDIVIASSEWAGSRMAASSESPMVIDNLEEYFKTEGSREKLEQFVKDGGRVLILNGGKTFADWRKDEISLYRGFKSSRDGGEIVLPKVPESPVFKGIKPLDMAWFADEGSRAVPMACNAVYQIKRDNKNVRELAESVRIHAYLNKPSDVLQYSGAPIVEIKDGKGLIIASEMRLKAGKDDPIAQRLFTNMLSAIQEK
jgi:hypothetical protein